MEKIEDKFLKFQAELKELESLRDRALKESEFNRFIQASIAISLFRALRVSPA